MHQHLLRAQHASVQACDPVSRKIEEGQRGLCSIKRMMRSEQRTVIVLLLPRLYCCSA